jgi:hypothetical protein
MLLLNGKSKNFILWNKKNIYFIYSEKIQPPLNILPIYINLAKYVLGPEYISIYVKYCYLDALVLLIQTFLQWTPGNKKNKKIIFTIKIFI